MEVYPCSRCPWCGRSLDSALGVGARLVRCGSCGVVLTSPTPPATELEAAYGEWYRPATGRFSGPGSLLLAWSRRIAVRRIDHLAPPGPVLDVGAGDGTMTAELGRRGREAVGVERLDGEAIPAPPTGSGGWAAVLFWHSLEHLPEPGAAIDSAAAALLEGGLLAIAIPNQDSLQAAVFGDRWLHLDLPRHLSHPSTDVLLRRLRRAGMTVTAIDRRRGGQVVFGWLHGMVAALPWGVDLYEAVRRRPARRRPELISPAGRLATLATATLLLPAAAIMACVEAMLGRPGTIYVEARRG